MLILNVIVLIAISTLVGYYLGKGNIVINKVANKADSAKMLKIQKKMEEDYNKAIAEFNDIAGGV